jgi:conjugative relaxase-like TrwC/TraI family protein
MLRIHARYSAKETKDYYKQALATSDYYTEKGEIIGQWRGNASEQIGLTGDVSEEQFSKLCDNINPITDEKLTARTSAKRRVAYDFTFSAPKSVSLAYAVNDDPKILEAFQSSYIETMKLIEEATETRVRAKGKNEDRVTGNIMYSDYVHSTTRPNEDGTPDPHLHAHCLLMNGTYDKVEKKWKAVELGNVHKNRPYYEAHFNNTLAEELGNAGYQIERTKHGFKLAGVENETEKRFSRRTTQIEKKTAEVEAKMKDKHGKDAKLSEAAKAGLGARTRKAKSKDYSFSELKEVWKERLSDDEKAKLLPSKKEGELKEKVTAKAAVDRALDHHLERKSAAEEKEVLTYAFKLSAGSANSKEILDELQGRKLKSKKTKDGTFYTTKEAVEEEKYLVNTVRENRGNYSPINAKHKIENDEMSAEQKKAVQHVLKSKDLVSVVAGGAGTGKTWSVKEIANGARKAGRRFHAFAPSASASRGVQVDEGFKNATTIAALLGSEKLQEQIKGGIVWIDEAGMLGNKTMNEVLSIAKRQEARILLTGDTKQHNSVERGDALRLIQKKGGVKPAFINTIRRQKPQDYKQAVSLISAGDVEEGFKALDKFGAIKESDSQQGALDNASAEYIEAREKKQEALVVATTHKQGKAVTDTIRDGLKEKELLTGEAKTFSTNQSVSYTEPEKQDIVNYEEGQILTFHKPGKGGFIKGRDYTVSGIEDGQLVTTDKEGNKKPLGLEEADRFGVFTQTETELQKGDLIRMTKNATSQDRKRINNGDVMTVNGFTKEGDIKATRGKTSMVLGKDHGHFTHGYYTTSPASQGKSVNKVIVLQTSASGQAANKEQFYVSASRGKFEISVHTDDKKGMLRNIQRSSERMTAGDVVKRGMGDTIKEKIEAFKRIARTKISKTKEAFYDRNLVSVNQQPTTKTEKHAIRR